MRKVAIFCDQFVLIVIQVAILNRVMLTKYGTKNMLISLEYFRAWNRATHFNPLMSF